jgi:hypothetical protein
MSDELTVLKPAPDRRVRHPDGRLLDAEGEPVPAGDPYWLRRLADEDVMVVEPAPAPKPKRATSGGDQ